MRGRPRAAGRAVPDRPERGLTEDGRAEPTVVKRQPFRVAQREPETGVGVDRMNGPHETGHGSPRRALDGSLGRMESHEVAPARERAELGERDS